MFKIRNSDFAVIGVAPELVGVINRPGIRKIDLWPAGTKTTVGIDWDDGASTIGDVPLAFDATCAWLCQRNLGGSIRHHINRKPSGG